MPVDPVHVKQREKRWL